MKWKVECQAKVRNSMSCATQCPTTLPLFFKFYYLFTLGKIFPRTPGLWVPFCTFLFKIFIFNIIFYHAFYIYNYILFRGYIKCIFPWLVLFFSLTFVLIRFSRTRYFFFYSLIRLPAGSLVGLVKVLTLPSYINLYIFPPPKEYFLRFTPLP